MCLLKLGRMSQANIVNGTLFPKRPKIKMEEWIQSGVIVGSLYFIWYTIIMYNVRN